MQAELTSTACHVTHVPLAQIDLDPGQPRKFFGDLDELASSMKKVGQLTPIMARRDGDRFVVIAGERRVRAAQSLGWRQIRVEVHDASPEDAFVLSVAENVDRQSLSPIEEAQAFKIILQRMTQRELGRHIGRDRSYVAQKLRLLRLPECLQHFLLTSQLTEGHLRQVCRIKEIYGDELMCKCVVGPQKSVPYSPYAVAGFLCALSPEDQPQWLFFNCIDYMDSVREAVALFCDELGEKERLPQWVVAALWWSASAAVLEISVADLSSQISAWKRRFLSAALWLDFTGKKEPSGRLGEIMLWGYSSDIRHSSLTDFQELPRDMQLEALGQGFWHAPSCAQPWGDQAGEFQELTAAAELEDRSDAVVSSDQVDNGPNNDR